MSKKNEKSGNVMYVGPTIKGRIRKSTVFKNGVLTPKAQQTLDEFPAMRILFVDIDDLAAAYNELATDSALKSVYQQAEERFEGR